MVWRLLFSNAEMLVASYREKHSSFPGSFHLKVICTGWGFLQELQPDLWTKPSMWSSKLKGPRIRGQQSFQMKMSDGVKQKNPLFPTNSKLYHVIVPQRVSYQAYVELIFSNECIHHKYHCSTIHLWFEHWNPKVSDGSRVQCQTRKQKGRGRSRTSQTVNQQLLSSHCVPDTWDQWQTEQSSPCLEDSCSPERWQTWKRLGSASQPKGAWISF